MITATKSEFENNDTIFGQFFVEAFKNNAADTDKNSRKFRCWKPTSTQLSAWKPGTKSKAAWLPSTLYWRTAATPQVLPAPHPPMERD